MVKRKNLITTILSACFMCLTMMLLVACGEKPHVHSLEHHDAVLPTCTTAGNVEYWNCTTCNKNLDAEENGKELDTIVVNALGHDMQHHTEVASTCTTTGALEYWHCARCNKDFTTEAGETELNNLIVPAKGHNYTYTYDKTTKTYNGVCVNDATHTDSKPAGTTEEFPLLVADEGDFVDVGVTDKTATATIYVKLTSDINLTTPLKINRNVVLDLGGKNVNYAPTVRSSLLYVNAEDKDYSATVKNGKLNFQANYTEGQGAVVQLEFNCQLTLNDVELNSNKNGITIWDNAKLTLNNSHVNAVLMALSNNNTGITKDVKVIANRSTFTSRDDTAIFVGGFMQVDMDACQVTGKTGALHIMMGDFRLRDTRLTSTSTTFTQKTAETISAQGTNHDDGAALIIRADLYYDRNVKTNRLSLDINNCELISANGTTASIYNCNDKSGTLNNVEDKTTVMNQFEYVSNILDSLNNAKVFNYDKTTDSVIEVNA